MPIFEGFLGEGTSNNSGVIENMDFHGFQRYVFGSFGNRAHTVIIVIIIVIIVFCLLSTDHKILGL